MFNILTYLEKSAAQYPDKIAFADKDKSITYEELVKRSKGIGSQLAKRIFNSQIENSLNIPHDFL